MKAHAEVDAALGVGLGGLVAAVAGGRRVARVAIKRVLILFQRDQLAHDGLIAHRAGGRLDVLGLRQGFKLGLWLGFVCAARLTGPRLRSWASLHS